MNRFLSRVVLLYHAALPVARNPIRHARAAARQYAHDARCDLIVFNAKPWPDKGKTMGIFCLKGVYASSEFFWLSYSLLTVLIACQLPGCSPPVFRTCSGLPSSMSIHHVIAFYKYFC